MPLIYTSTEAISRRMAGRVSAAGGFTSAFGPQKVDPLLLEQIGSQVEARVSAALGQVYRLPLADPGSRIAEIVELGVICELMPTHTIQRDTNPEDNFQVFSCRRSRDLLAEIVSGAVPLASEVSASGGDSPLPRSQSLAAQRNPGAAEAVQW
jgi:hypothetical protein